jgi:hypothetical protein
MSPDDEGLLTLASSGWGWFTTAPTRFQILCDAYGESLDLLKGVAFVSFCPEFGTL